MNELLVFVYLFTRAYTQSPVTCALHSVEVSIGTKPLCLAVCDRRCLYYVYTTHIHFSFEKDRMCSSHV